MLDKEMMQTRCLKKCVKVLFVLLCVEHSNQISIQKCDMDGDVGYEYVILHVNHITLLVVHHLIALTRPFLAMKTRAKDYAQAGESRIHGFSRVLVKQQCFEAHGL
ncbi:hypothetical protein LIER_42680 [Lithospermum erythrorhizon]|uniref:Uncharacterized protein n=1 Tax=Lithospermum erythrorhizon TaxID=34254 RepID=A0AAV3NR91_LITER